MRIYYCEQCGKRLSNEEAQRLEAAGTDPENVVCGFCAPKPQAPSASRQPAQSVSASRNQAISGMRRPVSSTGVIRPPTLSAPAVTGHQSGSRVAALGARAKAAAPEPDSGRSQKLVIAAVAGGILLGLVVVLVCRGGGEKKQLAQSNASTVNPVSAANIGKAASTPIAGPTIAPAAVPTLPPPPSNPQPAPPQPVAQSELTPKELYELKQKEAANKPPEEKKTEPVFGDWQSIFNGTDLNGWTTHKGQWRAEDGALVGEADGRGACIAAPGNYGDFELTCKVNMEKGRYFEVNTRSYGWVCGATSLQANTWRDIRVVARGNDVQATMDGQPMEIQAQPNRNMSGELDFYASKGCKIKVKDLRLRQVQK